MLIRVGENPWKGVNLQHVGRSLYVKADIDPRPVAACKDLKRPSGQLPDPSLEGMGNGCRTLEDFQGLVGVVQYPLGLVPVEPWKTLW